MQSQARWLTQGQFASICRRTSSWLREFDAGCWDETINIEISKLSPLSACSRLTALDLSYHVEIHDMTPVSKLTDLRTLRLYGACCIVSIEAFSCLKQLTDLDISKTKVASLDALQSLSLLSNLGLEDCIRLPQSALTPLAMCSALTTLDLRGLESLDLAPLASLLSLRQIVARGPPDLTPLQGLMPRLQVEYDW